MHLLFSRCWLFWDRAQNMLIFGRRCSTPLSEKTSDSKCTTSQLYNNSHLMSRSANAWCWMIFGAYCFILCVSKWWYIWYQFNWTSLLFLNTLSIMNHKLKFWRYKASKRGRDCLDTQYYWSSGSWVGSCVFKGRYKLKFLHMYSQHF